MIKAVLLWTLFVAAVVILGGVISRHSVSVKWPATWPRGGGHPLLYAERVAINSATMEELTGLDGVGPSRAQALLEAREAVGFFLTLSELDPLVTAVPPLALARIRTGLRP